MRKILLLLVITSHLIMSKTLQYPFSVSLSFIYIFLLCLWPKKTGSGLTKPMKTVRCSTVVTESLCLCICQVYIVLHGDDGVSNIRQLQAASCPLFRRNTRDTFILRWPWKNDAQHLVEASIKSWFKRYFVQLCFCLTPQHSWEFGLSLGASHLARQLWTFSQLVPEEGGGVWGGEAAASEFVNVLCVWTAN